MLLNTNYNTVHLKDLEEIAKNLNLPLIPHMSFAWHGDKKMK